MARYRKLAPSTTADNDDRSAASPQPAALDRAPEGRRVDDVEVEVAQPGPGGEPAGDAQRLGVLTRITIRCTDPQVAQDAVAAAAEARCMIDCASEYADIKATGVIARFLAWAAHDGVVDAPRAFRRGVVDEYLTLKSNRKPRGARECRNILYSTGRLFHSREFPSARELSAPRLKRQPAASPDEIRSLYRMIRELPPRLERQAQILVDLSYGVGARPSEIKVLTGHAFSAVAWNASTVCVVALPNYAGGVRKVPAADPAISERLLRLAELGTSPVFATHSKIADRNLTNRVNGHLRNLGYQTISVAALRNRWLIELAQQIPAALLLQLADVADMRILADQRPLLPHYTVEQSISLMRQVRP